MLVVARLDQLRRPLRELVDLVGGIEGRGVGFRSLDESLDTCGALVEFAREIIRERTLVGLESARAGWWPLDQLEGRVAPTDAEMGAAPETWWSVANAEATIAG